MHGLDQLDGHDDGTVFRDVIMLALLGFIVIVILLLPHLNPPTKAVSPVSPPGNVVIEARWPDGVDADVDLWVQAPGDRPVGYSNKGARVFNLLRDDLGRSNDVDGLNYEIAFSRGAPAGEYTVNLHLYRKRESRPSVPVKVSIGVQQGVSKTLHRIAVRDIDLSHSGEEVTVARFTLDDEGQLVAGSVHDLPKRLRSGGEQ